MKKTAVLLGVWLLLAGSIRADEPEAVKMPKELGPAPKVVESKPTEAAVPVATAPIAAAPCCEAPCCAPCGHCRCWGGHMRQVWDWLTWRPHHCYWEGCCCHHCDGCNPPVYTYFFCQCGYPCVHVNAPPYIGMDLPMRDRCCDLNYGHGGGCNDCGCGCH